jgi:hypothetical protein
MLARSPSGTGFRLASNEGEGPIIWGRPGDKTLIMELLEEDVEALRFLRAGPKKRAQVEGD